MKMEKKLAVNAVMIFVLVMLIMTPQPAVAHTPNCGAECHGRLCPADKPELACCSRFGYCGGTEDYCSYEKGCQSGKCVHYPSQR
ncbi:HEV1 [Linum grandiflorum]